MITEQSYVPPCEAERRLGLSYINLAAHGNKSHLGKYISEHKALVLFSKGPETIACLWDITGFRSITSKTLPFSLGMLWDWDWRAEAVEKAFIELLTPPKIQEIPSPPAPVLTRRLPLNTFLVAVMKVFRLRINRTGEKQ